MRDYFKGLFHMCPKWRQLRIWLTPPLALLALNLCGCAMGVFGTEAQERAKERMQRAREQMALAQEQIQTGRVPKAVAFLHQSQDGHGRRKRLSSLQ